MISSATRSCRSRRRRARISDPARRSGSPRKKTADRTLSERPKGSRNDPASRALFLEQENRSNGRTVMKTPNARLEDRRRECIEQALEAEKLALTADPTIKEGYLNLARAWRQLAEEIALAITERGNGGSPR